MQLALGRVHWGWCVFPLHNESLTQTLTDHRFLVTIILGGDSWTLIIILWLNPKKPFQHNTSHRRHEKSLRWGWRLHWGPPCLVGLSFVWLSVFVCLTLLFQHLYFLFMHKYIKINAFMHKDRWGVAVCLMTFSRGSNSWNIQLWAECLLGDGGHTMPQPSLVNPHTAFTKGSHWAIYRPFETS